MQKIIRSAACKTRKRLLTDPCFPDYKLLYTRYSPGTIITIDGTVMEILGYPTILFNADASTPAATAPANAATGAGTEVISSISSRSVLDTAPIIPAATASFHGLLNITENPNTPPKLAQIRNTIHCQSPRLIVVNDSGFNPSTIARTQAVHSRNRYNNNGIHHPSIPDRKIHAFARSNSQRSVNKREYPGMIKSMAQIYPASCSTFTAKQISSNFSITE